MFRTRSKVRHWLRAGPLIVGLLTAFLGGSCGSSQADPLETTNPPDGPPETPPETPPDTNTPPEAPPETPPVDTTSPPPLPPGPVTYNGIPFGPFGLWHISELNYGPQPFTGSHNYINADSLIAQINTARALGQRLVVAMTGGLPKEFLTDGQFDMAKWKSRMDTYNKEPLKAAVAAAVAEGTIVGNTLIDEPETKQWGTVLTKPMVDEMATYARNIFPTLPVGVNHGPPAYNKWRATEHYKGVDYVLYQYAHYTTMGDIVAWRDAVLAQAGREGAIPALSLNILNGGRQDREGDWDCTGEGQAGRGTRVPNCRMTPSQVVNWGKALAPYGCFVTLWRFDEDYMSDPANQNAFKELATFTASLPKRSCKK